MNKTKTILAAILIATICIVSCTNKNAEFNNALFDVHNEFQNNLKTLEEKLGADSLTKDSAIIYLANAKSSCDAQYVLFKKISTSKENVSFHTAVDSLLQKQLYGLTIQQKMFTLNEENDEYYKLESLLDNNNTIVDSFDTKVKAAQIDFAKKNKFTLQ
jgi:hypothetical protein